ncbi:DNA polymerase [Terrihalobacillus insolitus]|uniref:DNA polymerase n=1 Tax=Terrihalobacillus insolitus TaxID=2950438 RepID=UPI002341860F|nr:DNA polymerase [Terrihalobacillus insolitus]MDC3412552.1 DNA polymerase B [Terrihalobacillus insolitus]
MFTFYDFEVFKHDWLVVFEQEGQITRIHNDREALKSFLESVQFLVGFNNYYYDDIILCALLRNKNPYEISSQIISGKRPKLYLNKPITLDVMQEMKPGVSLKESEANFGLNIHETPVDFNIDRRLSKEELERTFQYCENDVLVTKKLFEKREDYFTSKFEIVQTFKLPANAVKKTRASLSAMTLKCGKYDPPADRLYLEFDQRLPLHELPEDIVQFYKDIEQEYKSGAEVKDLESKKYETNIAGVQHVFGFGGLHGAIENYTYEGNMMQIDVSSYYPSLMINNNFVSRASKEPELFKKMYDERLRLKEQGDSKQGVYKIILNSTFGASKSKFNPLFDPRQANNICVNGQLILTHLILLLEPFCKLIQSNTDGIVIAYKNAQKRNIIKLLQMWEEQYELKLDVDLIKKIAQRDVNNYAIQYEDGKVKAKGRFANFEGGTFERNSLCIIDKALVDYYIYHIPVQKTVVNLWKKNDLDWFQLIAKAGSTFKEIVHEHLVDTLIGDKESDFKPVQKVNRVFATNNKDLGGVYKTKVVDGTTRYNKIPWTSDHVLVWNNSLVALDKKKINLNWYIQLVKSQMFDGEDKQ